METRPMHYVSIYKDLSPEKRSSSTTQLLGNLYTIKLESLNCVAVAWVFGDISNLFAVKAISFTIFVNPRFILGLKFWIQCNFFRLI